MTNKQTEARIEKMRRACRPDLNDEEWIRFIYLSKTNLEEYQGNLTVDERKEYDRLAPFQVINVPYKSTYVITHHISPSVPCSPHFRREMEAFRIASWLNRLEDLRVKRKDGENTRRMLSAENPTGFEYMDRLREERSK